jgi:predicted NUDIX family NTP pyrophosphohydrolase
MSAAAVSLAKTSAGLLLFRRNGRHPEVLLGHPGGPFWRKKDHGAWTIPKGLIAFGEAPLERQGGSLRRKQAIGQLASSFPLEMLSGKTVHVWAIVRHRKVRASRCRILPCWSKSLALLSRAEAGRWRLALSSGSQRPDDPRQPD